MKNEKHENGWTDGGMGWDGMAWELGWDAMAREDGFDEWWGWDRTGWDGGGRRMGQMGRTDRRSIMSMQAHATGSSMTL